VNCNKCCSERIKLEFSKDKETGFHENYWWCNDCRSRIKPTQGFTFVVECVYREPASIDFIPIEITIEDIQKASND